MNVKLERYVFDTNIKIKKNIGLLSILHLFHLN